MGDGAEMALQYALNTELDAAWDELAADLDAQANPGSYFTFAGRTHRVPYPEESAELRRAIRRKQERDYDF